jgi:hypothetical protein
MHDLHVRCSGSVGWALSALFQRGVLVPVTAGTRLTDFLLISLEIPRADLEERVQTIFLDGRPVDDPATAVMGPGSVVALSASLPGLVGATMRKGGTYASLRSSISHTEAAREEHGRQVGLRHAEALQCAHGRARTSPPSARCDGPGLPASGPPPGRNPVGGVRPGRDGRCRRGYGAGPGQASGAGGGAHGAPHDHTVTIRGLPKEGTVPVITLHCYATLAAYCPPRASWPCPNPRTWPVSWRCSESLPAR